MYKYFDIKNSVEQYPLFSLEHILVLIILVLLSTAIFLFRGRLKEERINLALRYILSSILLISEIAFHLWYVFEDAWSLADCLPLQLCSISLILCILMLYTKNKLIYEVVFFTGIGGALQAILTPSLFYVFPHFRFFHFFIVHVFIIITILFMTWVNGYRPNLKSIWKTMAFLNIFLVLVLTVNYLLGSNYMFLSHKPDGASLIDLLGPHPYYIISLECIAMIMFFVLYIPFVISDVIKKIKK